MASTNGFLPVLPESIIERTLISNYLLGKGYLLCDLQYLPTEDADRLYEEACRFAKQEAHKVLSEISLTKYSSVGFSLN